MVGAGDFGSTMGFCGSNPGQGGEGFGRCLTAPERPGWMPVGLEGD